MLLEKNLFRDATQAVCIGREPNEQENAALREIFGDTIAFVANSDHFSTREPALAELALSCPAGTIVCVFSTDCSHSCVAVLAQKSAPFTLLQHGSDGELISIQQFSQKDRSVPWVKEVAQPMTA